MSKSLAECLDEARIKQKKIRAETRKLNKRGLANYEKLEAQLDAVELPEEVGVEKSPPEFHEDERHGTYGSFKIRIGAKFMRIIAFDEVNTPFDIRYGHGASAIDDHESKRISFKALLLSIATFIAAAEDRDES